MRAAACVELFRFSDFICLVVSAKPTQLHQVIGVYLVNILLLLIGQGIRSLLPNGWSNLQILRLFAFLNMNQSYVAWDSKTPEANQSTFIIRQIYSTLLAKIGG
jgi:hypothetical protein